MYGIPISDSVLINATNKTDKNSAPPPAKKLKKLEMDLKQNVKKLLKLIEMSDTLMMDDLKDEVEKLLFKTVENSNYLLRAPRPWVLS